MGEGPLAELYSDSSLTRCLIRSEWLGLGCGGGSIASGSCLNVTG